MNVSSAFKRLAIVAVFLGLGLAPGLAGAVYSYQGDDFAYNDGYYYVVVCDQESDGNPAYVRFETASGNYRIDDYNGSTAGCGAGGSDYGITRLKACEGQWTGDECDIYRYTGL